MSGTTNKRRFDVDKVSLQQRVIHRGRPGHICCNSSGDRTCIVEYDKQPIQKGPALQTGWIPWEQVEAAPEPAKPAEVTAKE